MANKVQPGDKLSTSPMNDAAFVNHVIDLVNHWQRGLLLNAPRGVNTHGDDNNIITVRNLTGADLAMGEVVKLGDYLLNSDEPKQRWYEALAVDTTFAIGYAVMYGPLPEDEIGRAYVSGMCPMRYTGTTPTRGDYIGPKPSSASMEIGYPGFAEVSDVVDSDDPKLVQATIRGITTLLCKATATLSAGPVSSNYQILAGTPASNSNSGFTVLPQLHLGVSIDNGKIFLAHWVNSCWVVTSWECNDA